MKLNKLLFPSLLLSVALAHGQKVLAPVDPENPGPEPIVSPPEIDSSVRAAVDPLAPPLDPLGGNTPVGAPVLSGLGGFSHEAPPPPDPVREVVATGAPIDDAGQIEEENEGFTISGAALNDIFQMLAKRAHKQYFHNNSILGPDFEVSGHLEGGDPLKQMEELAFMYGLTLYQKGNTVYALNREQLSRLPATQWHYRLRYFRPDDIETIKALIQPMLSPTGIANYEPKTNTIIIIDSAHHVDMARELLTSVDKPKGQIRIEVKILSINASVAESTGVNWSASLGEAGISLETIGSLNSLFGLDSAFAGVGAVSGNVLRGTDTLTGNGSIVLSPVQLSGVLRALQRGGLVTQMSNPTLITEDNEQATISLIDRVPIITTTINETEVSNQVTEEVRYQVDLKDPTGDPTTTREIGVTVAVTPYLLDDGTIRMKIRPRSAQIVEEIIGQSGNKYPRVSEAMIESITRIPNGHSLIIGGFYGQTKSKENTKVPILGDIPVLNYFFKSKEAVKETTSLVFVVTPTSYDPGCILENAENNRVIRDNTSLKPGYNWIEDSLPGPAHLPNLSRALKDLRPRQRDHERSAEELKFKLEGDGRAKISLRHGPVRFRRKR